MATQTPNYALNKPTVGGDADLWGDLLNPNFDTIDAEMKANADAAAAADAKADAAQTTADTADGKADANAADIATNTADIAINTADITQLGDEKVAKTGDTMTGPLLLPVDAPTADEEAANKKYVDDSVVPATAFYDPTGVASWRLSGDTLECWGTGAIATEHTFVFGKTFAAPPVVTTSGIDDSTNGAQHWIRTISETEVLIRSGYPVGTYYAIGEWDGVS